MFAGAVCCTLIIHNKPSNCSKFAVIGHSIASFPGPPDPECKHDNREEPGIFSHVSDVKGGRGLIAQKIRTAKSKVTE